MPARLQAQGNGGKNEVSQKNVLFLPCVISGGRFNDSDKRECGYRV